VLHAARWWGRSVFGSWRGKKLTENRSSPTAARRGGGGRQLGGRGAEVTLGEDLGGDGGVRGGQTWDAHAEAPMVEEGRRHGARGGMPAIDYPRGRGHHSAALRSARGRCQLMA
jgi:hypothetical protein